MRILIPIDESDLSTRAVEHVARGVDRGEVVLLHVTGIPPRLLEHRGGNTEEQEEQLEQKVGERSRRFEEDAIRPKIERELFAPAERRLLSGKNEQALTIRSKLVTEAEPQPALAIVREAEAGDYDAVVLGRHGHSGIKRFVLGGTASKVVHNLQGTPVWLVP